MHKIQEKLLSLASSQNIGQYTLRQIAEMIGEKNRSPQLIKHHLNQLEARGFIKIDKDKGLIERVAAGKANLSETAKLLILPIVGTANCGPATCFAENNIEGYLKISSSFLPNYSPKKLFVIQAQGLSMNKAGIDDGDYLIVDSTVSSPKDGDIVIAVIDEAANVKRFVLDKANNRIALLSDSTLDFPPIYIHPDDKFVVNGKVVEVIKNHNQR